LETVLGKISPLLGLIAFKSRLSTYLVTRRNWQEVTLSVLPVPTCNAFDGVAKFTRFKHKLLK
jgi:hypothetical protein